MNETELEAAQRELSELYRQLAQMRPFNRRRIGLQMQISRVRRRIAALQKSAPG